MFDEVINSHLLLNPYMHFFTIPTSDAFSFFLRYFPFPCIPIRTCFLSVCANVFFVYTWLDPLFSCVLNPWALFVSPKFCMSKRQYVMPYPWHLEHVFIVTLSLIDYDQTTPSYSMNSSPFSPWSFFNSFTLNICMTSLIQSTAEYWSVCHLIIYFYL